MFIQLLTALSLFNTPDSNIVSQSKGDYQLIWSDEFNKDGAIDTAAWQFENGFMRNNELQWYQPQNAWCKDGKLIIEARRETKSNPNYNEGSSDWRKSRKKITYTSASINTNGKKFFQYGRFEIRAKIIAKSGLWPAIWTLGKNGEWPWNGEIDIMEYYKGNILANVATGTNKRWNAKWFSTKKAYSSFDNPNWDQSFHTWRMDWDANYIRLYVDDLLLNEVKLNDANNPDGTNGFRQPHYILLNLAIGGDNGGDPSATEFPSRYEVDYVRMYQKIK